MNHLPTVRVPVGDLREGQTRVFDFEREGFPLQGFVVRWQGSLGVYVNRCPHVPYSLDFGDGKLLDESGKYLACSTHGGLFLPESGECFYGPPSGRRLELLPFQVVGDEVFVAIPPEPDDWP
jgi:nitrite reductase/ring-hydroxylating ferredoxin subunit